jgi:hypothetical protein
VNQHPVTADLVVRHVVNIGIRREQSCSIIYIHANAKRARFDLRALSGMPVRILPRTLSTGGPYAVLSSTPGMTSPIFRAVSKLTVLLGIGP